ncbi:Diacylglycerol kinase [Rhodobacteraceae bacterium THAF1]|uniref:diacylglycerol/lipid kinase family protein n=1 Tax=Palleronia sp. THAF1 TaxID=2587842 RepID=UPI000F3FE83F|nr:diacylglycerol kinase family protein [Palleronia sp. THAF1]QFU07598.1 Diacylglycerol kinase [Palleronia sp. THAF1]VDC22830.1 Diacylglycerol kinase [Rhodobacteraceae bacterium THAF1]
MSPSIVLIANRKSGQNSRDAEAVDRAMAAFGEIAEKVDWNPDNPISDAVDRALAKSPDIVVAAGGDGTVMAVAEAMLGKGVAMGVLPLGTFNFFARGLGLSENPEEAARQIDQGTPHDIRIGTVNGKAFLNNASLGIYPAILRERETVYSRWGRFRLAAHWSVVKTFLRFRKAMKVTITANGETKEYRTALVFVARSAYQLDSFGIDGAEAIDKDNFAVLVTLAETRLALFKMTARLVRGKPLRGKDYALISTPKAVIETRKRRNLLAFDGEKGRMDGPFTFEMSEQYLTIQLPPSHEDA